MRGRDAVMKLRVSDLAGFPSHAWYIGRAERAALVDAWRVVHHVSQAVAEVGKSWTPAAPDDSHSALTFHPDDAAPGCWVREGEAGAQLVIDECKVRVYDACKGEAIELDGAEWSISDLTARVREESARLFGSPLQDSVPAPDLPEMPSDVALDESVLEDLDSHYTITERLLGRLRTCAQGHVAEGAHELVPRLWPHHFDLASLAVVARDGDGGMTKTIGVGLTPPDSVDDAGYWYVSPWSKESLGQAFEKPVLPHGRWIDRGETAMAVLPVTEVWGIVEHRKYDDQHDVCETQTLARQCAAVAEFVATAFNSCWEQLKK